MSASVSSLASRRVGAWGDSLAFQCYGHESNAGAHQRFYKTRLCKFFAQGWCRFGRGCQFAHGQHELNPKPNLFKTQWCSELAMNGHCSAGAACRYAHRVDELRLVAQDQPDGARRTRRAARPARWRRPGTPAIQHEVEDIVRYIQELSSHLEQLRMVIAESLVDREFRAADQGPRRRSPASSASTTIGEEDSVYWLSMHESELNWEP
mmetsp:Transcript_22234/g.63789  ORF Transcript_22234/g.63789 Transcript_22234/m.63789 type:complete len:208 (-) Transcript_22234:63-686(-)